MTNIDEIRTAIGGATDDEKKAIANALGLSEPAGDWARVVIWAIVLVLLGAAFGLTIWLTYERSIDDASLSPFSEIAALTIGAIAGLLAPSPLKK